MHVYVFCVRARVRVLCVSVERFASEMDCLLDITLRSRLVEKLSMALYDCLFDMEERYASMDGDTAADDDVSRNIDIGLLLYECCYRTAIAGMLILHCIPILVDFICMYICMYNQEDGMLSILNETDHMAVVSVHAFLQVKILSSPPFNTPNLAQIHAALFVCRIYISTLHNTRKSIEGTCWSKRSSFLG